MLLFVVVLGGEDFDARIIDFLLDHFYRETRVDLRGDSMAMQRIKEAAEAAKCELSTAQIAAINLPFIAVESGQPLHLSYQLSRDQFEDLVRDLVLSTLDPCRNALEAAGLSASQIDQVILVGGQTRSPLVARTVAEFFGWQPSREINPDEVVAVGAAIQGAIIQGEIKDLVLLDVTPLALLSIFEESLNTPSLGPTFYDRGKLLPALFDGFCASSLLLLPAPLPFVYLPLLSLEHSLALAFLELRRDARSGLFHRTDDRLQLAYQLATLGFPPMSYPVGSRVGRIRLQAESPARKFALRGPR